MILILMFEYGNRALTTHTTRTNLFPEQHVNLIQFSRWFSPMVYLKFNLKDLKTDFHIENIGRKELLMHPYQIKLLTSRVNFSFFWMIWGRVWPF